MSVTAKTEQDKTAKKSSNMNGHEIEDIKLASEISVATDESCYSDANLVSQM